MKNTQFKTLLLVFSFTIILSACKKRTAFKEEDGQVCVDVFNLRTENDAVLNDINSAIENQNLIRGKGLTTEQLMASFCGLNMDTTKVLNGIITLNYNGETCNNRKRVGKVVITVQNYPIKKWKQKDCILKIDFIGFTITNVSNNKTIQLDGIEYLKNEIGGTWFDLKYLNQTPIIYSLTGNDIKVRFDKTEAFILNVGRKYTCTYSKSIMTINVEGIGLQGDKVGLDSWGQARGGNEFTSQIIAPLVYNTSCGTNKPNQGEVNITVVGKDYPLKVLFGTSVEGNSETLNNTTCAYGWRMEWSYKRSTKKRVFGYN